MILLTAEVFLSLDRSIVLPFSIIQYNSNPFPYWTFQNQLRIDGGIFNNWKRLSQ